MNWYWVWTIWLLAFIVSFAFCEGFAISTNGITLSRYTYNLSQDWPVLPWVLGVIAGGLAVHFWWHWAPKDIP